ncbi:MAG: alpha/beta fold hydrolase [Eggerthellaceae bacterium]
MVHGGLVDCDFFDGAATVLSRLFDVVTYDRRGYGRSDDPPSGEFDLAEQAEDAFAVASACFDAPFSLITHSVGASIGLGLMARHPGAVSRALIHEPLVLSCVPPDSDLAQVVAETRAATHRASVGSIGDGFLFGLAPKDDRAYEPSESERARTARNTSCSIVNEGSLFVSFEPDYEAVVQVPAVVGLGELGRTSPIGIIVETFARRAGMPVAHFPAPTTAPPTSLRFRLHDNRPLCNGLDAVRLLIARCAPYRAASSCRVGRTLCTERPDARRWLPRRPSPWCDNATMPELACERFGHHRRRYAPIGRAGAAATSSSCAPGARCPPRQGERPAGAAREGRRLFWRAS